MGRPKKDDGDKLEYHQVGFYGPELQLIRAYMEELGVGFGPAVRIIVRNALRRHGDTPPFTRNEGTHHDHKNRQ